MRRMAWKGVSDSVRRTLSHTNLKGASNDDEVIQILPRRKGSPPPGDANGGAPPPPPRATHSQSVLNMVNCIMGVGVLGYPYCFKESGAVLATSVMLFTMIATRASYQLLLHCAHLSGRRTYEQVAEHATGRAGRLLLEVCICASNLGCIVAYLNILADTLSSVAGTLIPPGAEPSRGTYMAGVTMLGALPVALVVRDHAVMSACSAGSVAFVVLFTAVITLMAILPGGVPAAADVTAAPMRTWDASGFLVALPVMAYSFTGHPYFLGIYEMLSAPSVRRMNAVTDQALGVTAVVYWLVGVCAYAVFRQRTAGDVLRNFGGADVTGMRGAYERAIKACFALAVLGSIPLAILPFYTIVQPLLRGGGGACGAAAAACGGAAAAACGGAAGGAPGPRGRGAGAHLKARLSGGSGDGAPPGRAPAVIRSKDLREQGSGPLPGAGADDDEWAAVVTGSEVGGRSGAEPRRRTAAPDGGEALPVSSPPLHGGGGAGGGHAHARGGGGDVPPGAPSPSSGSMLGPHLDPHLTAHDAEVALSFPQHALLTFLLLGTGMAAALWLPNLEFIFGLTGATTSVVIAFIMPALCFLRLAGPDPEVAFGGFGVAPAKGGAAGAAAAGVGGVPVAGGKPGLLAPPELRAAWVWRRRVARALLAFGLVAGVLCTHATLSSIQEEAAVVQLAQELVAHEVVVAEAAHAQIKAKEAAAAISVVQDAAQHLSSVRRTPNETLGALEAAAAALSAVANNSAEGRAGGKAGQARIWDIQGQLAQHKQKVVEDRALGSVEHALSGIEADMRATMDSVASVVAKLDAAIANIKEEAARTVQGVTSTAAAAADKADKAKPKAVPSQDGSAAASEGRSEGRAEGGGEGRGAAGGGAGDAAAAGDKAAGGDKAAAPPGSRVGDLAHELGKALGVYSSLTSAANATAGRSLEGVRSAALVALSALGSTVRVLDDVRGAVRQARSGHQHDAQVRETAVLAMQRALNATAVSTLALQITDHALRSAASEESSELLSALQRVAHDLESEGKAGADAPEKAAKAGKAAAAAGSAAGGKAARGDAAADAGGGGEGDAKPAGDAAEGARARRQAPHQAPSGEGQEAHAHHRPRRDGGAEEEPEPARGGGEPGGGERPAGAKDAGKGAAPGKAPAPAEEADGGGAAPQSQEERVQRVKEVIARLDQALATKSGSDAAQAEAASKKAASAASPPSGAGAAESASALAAAVAPGGAGVAVAAAAAAAAGKAAEDAAAAGKAAAVNTELQAAIKEAVEWTESSKTEALTKIQEKVLDEKNARVAARAADIVADLGTIASREGGGGGGGAGEAHAAVAAAAAEGKTALAAEAASEAAAAKAAAAGVVVAGPVVRVDRGGKLVQAEEAKAGPEVRVHADGRLEQVEGGGGGGGGGGDAGKEAGAGGGGGAAAGGAQGAGAGGEPAEAPAPQPHGAPGATEAAAPGGGGDGGGGGDAGSSGDGSNKGGDDGAPAAAPGQAEALPLPL